MRAGPPWRAARAGVAALAGLVLVYLVLPTLVIVPLSFSSESFMSFPPPGFSPRWYQAFAASVDYRLASGTASGSASLRRCLATALGTLAALGLVRGELRGRRLLSALMLAPLILPQIVLAIGLFPVMVRLGIIGTYPAILFGPRRRLACRSPSSRWRRRCAPTRRPTSSRR